MRPRLFQNRSNKKNKDRYENKVGCIQKDFLKTFCAKIMTYDANRNNSACQTCYNICHDFMHTNDAPSALTRLMDLGVAGYLVASTVEAVLAQRLVRTVCEDCAESVPAGSDFRDAFG